MNLDDAFQTVRSSVTIGEVLQSYGITEKRGFAKCCFHPDKTASMKIYKNNNTYYCFGCTAGGDIFQFVAVMDGISRIDALKKINKEFGCGVSFAQHKRMGYFDVVSAKIRKISAEIHNMYDHEKSSPIFREAFPDLYDYAAHDAKIKEKEKELYRLCRDIGMDNCAAEMDAHFEELAKRIEKQEAERMNKK